MVARLELQNGLAPVQEYGRHYVQAGQANKKKKVQKPLGEDDNSEIGNNFNDQYYDLDDGFIDDAGMGSEQQEDQCYSEFLESTMRDQTSDTRQNMGVQRTDKSAINVDKIK